MKQLQQSLATVTLIGLLSVSCMNKTSLESTMAKEHPKKNSEIVQDHDQETYHVTPSDYLFSKETISPSPNLLPATNNFELAHNIHSFSELHTRKEFSFFTTLLSVLLTLSFCKLYLNSIDNENYWFDSEMKRMKKTKKSSLSLKEFSQTQYN